VLVWMFWKSDIYLASVGNRALDLPARSVVTILSKLPSSRFHISTYYFFSLSGVALCITFRFFRWRLATRYGLEGPGTESRRGRDFPHLSRPAPRPTQPPVQWVPGLSRGQGGRDVVLTTHPHLVPRYTERRRAIPLLSPKRPSRSIRKG
jgi:hypothetical protein